VVFCVDSAIAVAGGEGDKIKFRWVYWHIVVYTILTFLPKSVVERDRNGMP
jgi:hypothetical protein